VHAKKFHSSSQQSEEKKCKKPETGTVGKIQCCGYKKGFSGSFGSMYLSGLGSNLEFRTRIQERENGPHGHRTKKLRIIYVQIQKLGIAILS
jgi:hypothetical protein